MPDEPTPPTGLILQGDVAALRREVRVLRRLNATIQGENTRLRQALQAARLPHAATCPAYTDATLPCGCRASQHNAAIDAVLEADT
jgi:hypothetical protein